MVCEYAEVIKAWGLLEIQAALQLELDLIGPSTDSKAIGLRTSVLQGLIQVQKLRLGYVDKADTVEIHNHYHAPEEVAQDSVH